MSSLKQSCPLVALAFAIVTGLSLADEWAPPKKADYYSPTRTHVLKVTPSGTWPREHGNCVATLSRLTEEAPAKVWSRHLANNLAPVDAFVTDSGNYVVTLDEWGAAGTFPIVVYGKGGRLIRMHTLDTLSVDPMEINATVSNFWWREQAIPFFGPEEEVFLIRLRRGQMLMVELRSGDLMDEKWYEERKRWAITAPQWEALQAFGKQRVREILRAQQAARRERVREHVQKMRDASEQRNPEERASGNAPERSRSPD